MVIFLGKEVVFVGKQLQVGDQAPDFSLTNGDLEKKSLADFAGKKILSIIPSVDTGVCSAQTRRFNEEATKLDDVTVLTISVDLPFAQKRFCAAEGLDKVVLLSDYYDNNFGKSYGLLMEEWNLLARAVLILDENNKVIYTDYVEDVHEHPDYEAALAALN